MSQQSNQQAKKRSPISSFLLTFAIVFLATQLGLRMVFPQYFEEQKVAPPIVVQAENSKSPIGRDLAVFVTNGTNEPIELRDACPAPQLLVERKLGDNWEPIILDDPAIDCETISSIDAQSKERFNLSPWKYEAFSEPGTYRVSLLLESITNTIDDDALNNSVLSTMIKIEEPGFFVGTFRVFISKPILNMLILIASIIPNHSLGWSIIILTLLVKLILFFPTQHALESQRKLQSLQPQIEAIKKKYANDQKKVTEETMQLWRDNKINPFQSCLPTLIQIPILLGLFFIIRDSSAIELAQHLVYSPFADLSWSFNPVFLGLIHLHNIPFDGISWSLSSETLGIILRGLPIPALIAGMQFFQMRLAFSNQKNPATESAAMQQQMMMYALPVMILFFSGSLPIAVSVYWGASTVFAIGQQLVVNNRVK